MTTRHIALALTSAIAIAAVAVPVLSQNQRSFDHLNGQTVAPVYDGYEVNPDGTYSMWFSYFNRNRQERVDIPIGRDNRFEPGPDDRGQPTHFVPLWQKSLFRVVLPKDWGDKKLVWHLTTRGSAQQVVASLDPRAIIDRQKTTLAGGAGDDDKENLAPKVVVEPMTQSIALSDAANFTVTGSDDGKPVNLMTKRPEGLRVRWRKFRGPQNGRVTFSPGDARLVDGKGGTKATFSQPGEYIVQAVVDDGSVLGGTYCCWVNTELKVTVK
jgi:hypothetical protein